MSKKSRAGTERDAPPSALGWLTRWLARRSRLSRSLLAGICALILSGALGLYLYGYLLGLPPGSMNIGPVSPETFANASLILTIVVGIAAYYYGWRVLIGFDGDETPFRPGRAAAILVLVSVAVLLLTIGVMVVNALIAVSGSN